MNKMEFDNSMARQGRLSPEFVKIMQQRMTFDKLVGALPLKELFDAQKIIITGCGDSWLCGIATKPTFESVAKMDVEVLRNVEFSRYFPSKALGYSPNTPLVVVISISGQVSRAIEALRRANHYGANTIAITNDPQSPVGKEAKHVIPLDMPQGEYGPGLNSYIASMSALNALALRIARAKNTICTREEADMKKAILDYADAWAAIIDDVDNRAFELAKTWKDLRCVDFVGDYADYATAFFGSAKVIECYGGYTTYDDSEDWCHINYFLREPQSIGRVFILNSDTPSFGRIKETLAAVEQLGSPCIVVTDAPASEFPASFTVFTTPKAKYFWLSPLMQHLPFDFVSGYIAELLGIENFRRDMDVFKNAARDADRIRGSKIEII